MIAVVGQRSARVELALALDERLRRKRMLIREDAAKNLRVFFRHFAWPVLEPRTPFMPNWHIDAICEHLQAITEGQITRLIISVPFRMLKSTLVSQTWPAWEWLTYPQLQYLTGSYQKDLSMRDAVNSRRIIESDAYQEAFGDRFQMTSDQNVKTRYENNKRGSRFVTSTDAGATGFGGNRLVVDDPLNSSDADSAVKRKDSIEWFKGTVSTRFNNPKEDAAVVVHQRLHEGDLTGHLLAEQPGVWEHLVLPMRYSAKRQVMVAGRAQQIDTASIVTSLGFRDPRTVEGELLFPARLDEPTVCQMETMIGAYHTQAQLQQQPTARSGVIFQREHWQWYRALPQIDEKIISVDCTFKGTDGSDFVAIQVVGRKGANKFLIKRIKERMGFAATLAAVRSVRAEHDDVIATIIEDKANGSAIVEALKTEIEGVIAINPDGGKEARAYAVQPQHEAGNFYLPDPSICPDIDVFVTELSAFPNGPNDDEVDAWTQAVNWFASRERNMGVFDHYKAEAEALRAAQEQAHG